MEPYVAIALAILLLMFPTFALLWRVRVDSEIEWKTKYITIFQAAALVFLCVTALISVFATRCAPVIPCICCDLSAEMETAIRSGYYRMDQLPKICFPTVTVPPYAFLILNATDPVPPPNGSSSTGKFLEFDDL